MISSVPFPKRMLKSEMISLIDDFILLAQGKGKLGMSRTHPDVVCVFLQGRNYNIRYEDWLIVAPVVDTPMFTEESANDVLFKFESAKVRTSLLSLINESSAPDYLIVE